MATLQTRTQPKEGFGQKVKRAAEVVGAIKGMYDTGKTIWSAAQAAAPYLRTAMALI